MDHSETFGLSREVVEIAASAYAGYGVAKEREVYDLEHQSKGHADLPPRSHPADQDRIEESLLIAGSSLAVAGSLYSLVEPSVARLAFFAAADVYSRLN